MRASSWGRRIRGSGVRLTPDSAERLASLMVTGFNEYY